MKILVTGVAGFIGFHTARHLLNSNIEIFGIDNMNDYYSVDLKKYRLNILNKFKGFKFLEIDLNNIEKINKSFDIVIHLAAQAGVRLPKAQKNKYIHSNINGFYSILNYCQKYRIKKLIYASSSSVYSGNSEYLCSEKDCLSSPSSMYAKTKILNEEKVRNIKDLSTVGLRFFSVYGPYGRPDMAYYSFTNNILSNEKITVFNDGNTSRDYTYIDDAVSGIANSIEFINNSKPSHNIFNIGGGKKIATLDLLRLIEERYAIKAKIIFANRKNETASSLADLVLSRKILNYSPKTNFQDGINKFFDWYDNYLISKK